MQNIQKSEGARKGLLFVDFFVAFSCENCSRLPYAMCRVSERQKRVQAQILNVQLKL